MPNILLLATAWGPKHGGINAFNMDFAAALAEYLKPSGRVFCAVLSASREDCESARAKGVTLVPIDRDINRSTYDESWAYTVWEKLQKQNPKTSIDWWVGHDVISAEAALKGPEVAQRGRTAIIMHMNYVDYIGYKYGSGAEAARKEERQSGLFKQAHRHFAVGPLLRDAMADMVEGKVTMLVPGFAEVPIRPAAHRLTLITFGRMDRVSDRIKQGALAVAGFGCAIRLAYEMPGLPKLLRENPQLRVVGISEEGGEEEESLRDIAHGQAGREINLLAQPFDENRAKLFDQLGRANIALMLSWHEGFGLTGWEAVAAGVPLIVSRQSGLYKLVDESLGRPGTACLHVIDVQGNRGGDELASHTEADRLATRDAIIEIARELGSAREQAQWLKQHLQQKLICTWENTARQFVEALGPADDTAGLLDRAGTPPSPDRSPGQEAAVDTSKPGALEVESPPPLIGFPERPWQVSSPIDMPDSLMLLPQSEIVSFHSYRRGLLYEILGWALAKGEPIELRLQAGEGGTGKTRLTLAACHELEDNHGWRVGFLLSPRNIESEFPRLLGEGRDCFIVVDYAETRPDDVVALTQSAFKAPKKGKVRLLLLARDGGDWWDRLADRAKDTAVAAILREPSTKAGPYRMSEQPIEPDERSAVFHEALASFAKAKRQEIPSVAPPDTSADHFGQIFFIHLAALATLRGFAATSDRELLNMALGHERAYWRRLLEGAGLDEAWLDGFEQTIALLTLLGGASSAREAKTTIRRTPRLRGAAPNINDQIFDLLRRLYRHAGGIGGLQPDLLGERLVADALRHDDELIDVALEKASASERARYALTVLTRLAKRDPAEGRWLARALERHIGERAQEAFEVAMETGAPMPEMLAAVLRSAERGTQRRLVRILRPKLPEETVNLKGLAIDLTAHYVTRLKIEKGDRPGWKAARQLKDAYQDLADRHRVIGEFKESVAAQEQVIHYATILARSGKDVDRAALGIAHGRLAQALSRSGQFESALLHAEAAENILRGLADRPPANNRANWAVALSDISRALSNLGRYQEAMEKQEHAEAIQRKFAEDNPERSRDQWAQTLIDLSHRMMYLGRYEEALQHAEQAELIARNLAQSRPDIHRINWSVSLDTIGNCLNKLGRCQDALNKLRQGETIGRELANRQPDEYRNYWCSCLINIGNCLRDLHEYDKALDTFKQAEAIRRELAEREPEAFLADWALAAGNLAESLILCNRPEDAVSVAEEGAKTLADLAAPYPNVNRDRHGWCTRVLAEALLAMGDKDRGLERAFEAHSIWAAIFAERPAYGSEQYGKTLPVLAQAQLAAEGKAPAIVTLVRGIKLIEPFFQQRPPALRGVMEGLIQTLRDIDPVAASETVPTSLVEQLDRLGRPAEPA